MSNTHKMRSKKIKIQGHTWTCHVIDDETFTKQYTDQLLAFTMIDTKQIMFRLSNTIETITHEIIHCHFSYTHTSSTKLKQHQVEEIFCDLFASRGEEILKQSKLVYRWLRRR